MGDVSVSKRYEVSGAQMWERIGDPRDIYRWHPTIEATDMADDARSRINTRTDGGRVAETILDHGKRHHTYRIDESPLPLSLVATIRVRDEEDATCVVQWEGTFHATGMSDAEAGELVRAFFQAGLEAL